MCVQGMRWDLYLFFKAAAETTATTKAKTAMPAKEVWRP